MTLIRRVAFVALALLVLTVSMVPAAHAGRIVLANDEWTLSDSGFALAAPNDPGQFAQNVAAWFTGGGAGSFRAWSTNFGLTGSNLASAMTGAGHTWTVSTAGTFDLATLMAYDGVFVGGNTLNNTVLIDYVNAGGNVYLMGGTGSFPSAAAEAAAWNPFLNAFGLGLQTSYNGITTSLAISSPHAIFTNVDHLYQQNGSDTLDIAVLDGRSQILVSQDGHGLYAVFDGTSVPAPGALVLVGLGASLVALAGRARR